MTNRDLKKHVRGEVNDLAQSLTRLTALATSDEHFDMKVTAALVKADDAVDDLVRAGRKWWGKS